jgi:hypothetical protein
MASHYAKNNVNVAYLLSTFLKQLSMSKFPQRPSCTTLKPFVSEYVSVW